MPNRASPLAPFRVPAFRILWTATLVSNLGTLIQTVGAGWMMTSLTDSHSLVALVQASNTLPIMVFALAAGALADNFDRRLIMLTAQTFMFIASIALAVFAFKGWLTPWLLLSFTFLIGCGMALHTPSWQASMGDIVPRTDLPSAVALNSMGFNMMRSVGPAIGGMIVAIAGAAAAFAVNAVSYIALISALALWRRPPDVRQLPREQLGPAISAGVRYVAMSPNLITIMARSFIFGVSSVAIMALLPLVARDMVDGTAITYGLMLGAFGIGAILAALAGPRLREVFSNETITRGAFAGFALAAVVLALSPFAWLSHAILLLAGAAWVLALSLFNVSVQLSTPRWVVGRALALYQTATFGGMAVGSWIWGTTADAIGPQQALIYSAVVLLFGAVVGLKLPLPEVGGLNLDPLDRFNEPALRLDLTPRSGPILVTVEYLIEQEDVTAFLALMRDRRRIRIRDGARQWSLLRDLENPDVWTETYHVPTWVEYVRHNQRRTKADAEVYEQLLELHQGEARPVVRRMIERQAVPHRDDTPVKPIPYVP